MSLADHEQRCSDCGHESIGELCITCLARRQGAYRCELGAPPQPTLEELLALKEAPMGSVEHMEQVVSRSVLRWVCDRCRNLNDPEAETCGGCHAGRRGDSVEKLTPRGFLLDERLG